MTRTYEIRELRETMETQFMLFLAGDTHQEFLVQVQPCSADLQAQYRPGVVGYDQVGNMEKLLVTRADQELGIKYDWNIDLTGRYGAGALITAEQVEHLRKRDAEIRAERQRPVRPATMQDEIASGDRCHSCGKLRRGRGECPHCGDDTRY